MSHIHIPDGSIALWLWVLGYILTGIYFIIFSWHLKKTSNYKKISIVSALGALMLLSMSIPVPFIIPYHLNLSALAGILVGPLYAGIAIFSVNLIMALIGHGGITIVGLNTVILTVEAAIAFLLFKIIRKIFSDKVFLAGFIATFLALITSSMLTLGVVYAGTKDLNKFIHSHNEHGIETKHEHNNEKHEHEFNAKKFLTLILITGVFGWTLEAFITGFIIDYINRVKPEVLNAENTGT